MSTRILTQPPQPNNVYEVTRLHQEGPYKGWTTTVTLHTPLNKGEFYLDDCGAFWVVSCEKL